MVFNSYIRYAKYICYKRDIDPLYIVFFITQRCTAQCRHCLLGSKAHPGEELTINEIEQISKKMNKFLFFLPTGGEPFLREDIAEIVKIFYQNNAIKNVGIPTNGSLTDKVIEDVVKILESCKGIDFAVDVSFDGIGEEHDRIRNFKGLFEKAVWTYQELAKIEKKYPNFNLNVAITISSFNQDRLEELYEFLVNKLKVKNINHLLTRGNPRDPLAKEIDVQKYEHFSHLLAQELKKNTLSGYSRYLFADFVNAMKIVRQRVILDTIRQKRLQVPCYAGILGGVIYSNGDLFPCELLDTKIGNLREHEYNFKDLWKSQRAKEIRENIKSSKCFCTYECFLTNSILFTPSMLTHVLTEWLKIKSGRVISKWRKHLLLL